MFDSQKHSKTKTTEKKKIGKCLEGKKKKKQRHQFEMKVGKGGLGAFEKDWTETNPFKQFSGRVVTQGAGAKQSRLHWPRDSALLNKEYQLNKDAAKFALS